MNGVLDVIENGYAVFIVENLSDEMKSKLRSYLSFICNGNAKAEKDIAIYNYKNTLKAFCARYDDKVEDQKIGQIGELLINFFIREYFSNALEVCSPFFNIEERGPKKGFDIILTKKDSSEIWFTEVKSGLKNATESEDDKINTLINRAKADLYTRISQEDPDATIWRNAISSASLSISNRNVQKEDIVSILENLAGDSIEKPVTLTDLNVVLAGTLFSDTRHQLSKEKIEAKYLKLSKDYFKQVYVIACQKSTYEAISAFLHEEAESV